MIEENEVIPTEAEEVLPPEAKTLLRVQGRELTQGIALLKVTNEATYKRAVDLGVENTKILKQIETFRKAIVQPINDQVKKINNLFKAISAKFEANDSIIRHGIEQYQNGRKKTESIQNVEVVNGRATIQERRDWELEDGDKVPEKYWVLDEVAIGKVIRAGGEIPGIKVVIKKTTAFCAA